ncbi:hypothetical protein BH11ACT2_BH11ACT2_12860 [soil metagenome]
MHIVAIGDIGVVDDMIHIGDEAMFEQLVAEVRARGIGEIVALSSAPSDTADRYGVRSIARIGFSGARAEMTERMRRVLAGELGPGDPALDVIAAVESSAGVAIAGGGNMTSLWPLHIYERATLGALAARAGVPLVVSGQTIGPQLSEPDAALVTRLLASARLVGVRESASLALVRSLGIDHATLTIDDASYLPVDSPPEARCLVTLAGHVGDHDREAFVGAVAALLDDVATSTGLEIVFSPHFGSTRAGEVRGDSVMHADVARRLTAPSREIPATHAARSGVLARSAALVISSRYHPAVFAVPGGVPTIGIAVDDYTTVKLTGALGNFNQSSVLDAADLISGEGRALLARVWRNRDAIRAGVPHRQYESAQWWSSVAATFS